MIRVKAVLGRLFSKMYLVYKYDIFPRISSVRGSYRLLQFLANLSVVGVERVDGVPESIFDRGGWDNLIILDACRHDLYEEVKGEETEHRISYAGGTKQFISEVFAEGDHDDIVYITANPHFHEPIFKELTGRELDEVFHSVFHVYKEKWSEREKTVLPGDVVEQAVVAEKLFPDKRKIIHFMQPHQPFIGFEIEGITLSGFDPNMGEVDGDMVWELAEKGVIDPERVWEGYKNNLEAVLEGVEDLKNSLNGEIAITSDHGNYFGENGLYGHKIDSDAKALRKVPWDPNF